MGQLARPRTRSARTVRKELTCVTLAAGDRSELAAAHQHGLASGEFESGLSGVSLPHGAVRRMAPTTTIPPAMSKPTSAPVPAAISGCGLTGSGST